MHSVIGGAGIDAAGVAGFLHHDLAQRGQSWQQPVPDPACQVLAGRVLQPLDVVEAVVVELIVKRLESLAQVGEIHDPARLRADGPGDVNFDAERMPVHASALVPLRYIRQAMRRLRDRSFRHEPTPSTAARTAQNPLFPVNLADLLLRHCGANHKRETIAFSKRRQGALYRAAIWVVWKNYIKSLSENRRDAPPAKRLGLIARALTVKEVLATRLLPDREPLSGWLEACYFGRIPTRAIAVCRVHRAKYAI